MTNTSEIIVNTVQEVRRHQGVTQEELAQAVGVSRQTIIAVEKGNYTPSVLLALKISETFSKKVEDIFKYE